jgi:hypothetical protein
MRLFVNTDDHRLVRRIQIQSDYVGCFRAELRVCRELRRRWS